MVNILPSCSSLVASKGGFLFIFFIILLAIFSQRFLSKASWFIKALSSGFENMALKFTAGFSQIFDPGNKTSSWAIPEKKLGSMKTNNREITLNRWRMLTGVTCLNRQPSWPRDVSPRLSREMGCKRSVSFPGIWAQWRPSSLPTLRSYDIIIAGCLKITVLASPEPSIF